MSALYECLGGRALYPQQEIWVAVRIVGVIGIGKAAGMHEKVRADQKLVDPSRRQVWRAGLPYHLIALFVLVLAAVVPDSHLAELRAALIVFLLGVGRSVSWLLGVGKCSIIETDVGLGLARRGRVVHLVPWGEIERLEWGGGSRFPSIDNPVSFPILEIVPADIDELVLEDILVIGRRARRQADEALVESCRRHGVKCEINGPDTGLTILLLGGIWRRLRGRRG